jgi:hypothetical protein
MAVTNTPTYYDASTINAVKGFVRQAQYNKTFGGLIVVVF